MRGTVLQVSISNGGLPKSAIVEGFIGELGIAGDLHKHTEIHGGPEKAILIVGMEIIEELKNHGYPLYPGAMGENLTTRGIDIRALRLGDRLTVGGAELELTKIRKPCRQLQVFGEAIGGEIFDPAVKAGDATSPRWGMSGFYAKVLRGGPVRAGDNVSLVER